MTASAPATGTDRREVHGREHEKAGHWIEIAVGPTGDRRVVSGEHRLAIRGVCGERHPRTLGVVDTLSTAIYVAAGRSVAGVTAVRHATSTSRRRGMSWAAGQAKSRAGNKHRSTRSASSGGKMTLRHARLTPGKFVATGVVGLALIVAACGSSSKNTGTGTTTPATTGGAETSAVTSGTTIPVPVNTTSAPIEDKPVLGGKLVVGVEAEVANAWVPPT